MGDAATSALVKLIFEKLGEVAFKEYARAQGIHSELEKLGENLSQIQALLHDASDKEIKEDAVKQWLNRLQHLAYDIEDVLDDVATEAMRRELTQGSGASTSKVKKLIVPTCCTNFSLSRRLSPKIDSITIELQRLYKEKGELGLTVKDGQQKDPNRGNETCLLESNVVGREGEKKRLLNKLLGDDGSSKENFSIVPIVGIGGVGKTTLARLLYNDPLVKDHFQLKVWVCVSDDFDIFKISQTIYQDVTIEVKKHETLNQLQMALAEQLKDKRFLLVLDDVWHQNCADWDKLVRPFYSGAPQSRVIITTRKKALLERLGFDHIDLLGSLSSEDALSLFALHALGVDNFDSHPTLRETGESIVKKCAGLPLALKAIGSLLRTKAEKEDWDAVVKSEIWDIEIADEIVPALRLSYHDLSADLKRLFVYCSLFPKDFLFDKEELVLLWAAEGFLNQSNATMSPERSGDEYFEALLSRSFFQHAPNDESLFVMHDSMNDLATFVSGDYFLRFNNQRDMGKEALAKYRHMSFIRENYVAYPKFEGLKRAKGLRTFLAVYVGVDESWLGFHLSNKILVDLLPKLPLLRVLSLSHFQINEVPGFIGRLKHLRYLNLSQTEIEVLPENVGNLYNLEALILFGCKKLSRLPKSFLKLTKLRHLDIKDTPKLKELPLGIGELKNLQTLTKIFIGGDGGFHLTDLKGLNNLHGELSIEGLCNVKNAMNAHEAKLSLKRLTKLELKWGDGSQHGTLEEEVLNELKPDSECLKELAIKSYGGIEFPEWVGHPSFHRLVDVSISDCKNCTSLPPLGQLPSLEILRFENMQEWDVWSANNGVFDAALPRLRELHIRKCPKFVEFSPQTLPSLEILWFEDMLGWKTWSTNDAVFPRLRELHIYSCPELIDVSAEALPSLRVLDIAGCGDGVLRSLVRAASSITKLKMSSISGLTYEVWRGVIEHIGAVEEVSIWRCHEIRYLWESEEEASKVLVNIKKLAVSSCSNLVSLGEKEEKDNFGSNLLSSLRILEVKDCKKMERCCCPNSIESLYISYCSSLAHVSFPAATGGGGQKLKSLRISGCEKLTEKISSASMPMLESIDISGWTNLKSIMQLGNFIYLTELYLCRCPSLESFPDIPLPVLTRLTIKECNSMESFPDIPLPVLTHLIIDKCNSMESLSALQMKNLSSLKELKITNCNSMESLSALQMKNLSSLKELTIRDCPSIDASCHGGVWPPNLCSLEIGGLKKPMSEWGPQNFPSSFVDLTLCNEPDVRNFRQLSHLFPSSLTELWIKDFDNLESLSMGLQHLTSLQRLSIWNCPKLKLLPKHLTSLQHLTIWNCPKMKHLPKQLLPSLLSLDTIGCPKLRKRCEGYPLISHIPRIDIV